MLNSKMELRLVKSIFSWVSAILFLYPGDIQAAETSKPKMINDIRPPFTFSINTQTPAGKPQPGVQIRCLHVITQLRVGLFFAAAKNPFSSERHSSIFAVQALRVELGVVDFP